MYTPTWIDVPLTICSFMIVYEIYRKNVGVRSVWNPPSLCMGASVICAAVTTIVNRNETVLSVPLFIASMLCLTWGVYVWKTKPRKLPTEPALA